MEKIKLTGAEIALVLIDLQNGIVAQATQPRPGAEVVENAVRLRDAVERAGGTIFLVHVNFPHFSNRLAPKTDQKAIPPTASAGWSDFVPALVPRAGDVVIEKRQWGAFYGTELDLQLRRRKINTIVLAGIATAMGVESTARDAYERGYEQIFVEDAMASRTEESHRYVVSNIFPLLGRVRATAEVVAVLE